MDPLRPGPRGSDPWPYPVPSLSRKRTPPIKPVPFIWGNLLHWSKTRGTEVRTAGEKSHIASVVGDNYFLLIPRPNLSNSPCPPRGTGWARRATAAVSTRVSKGERPLLHGDPRRVGAIRRPLPSLRRWSAKGGSRSTLRSPSHLFP